MGLLDEFRVDIGDDTGAIPSGIVPVPGSGLPVGGIPVHDLLSPQHGDTTPAAPSPGDLILGGLTWAVLSSGNEGERLTVLGGQVRWAPDPSSSGDLAAHTGDPNAHHTRYTDAEASGVAVQVVTTGILEHTNISGAHHARYTDAEAIAAASGALDHHLRYTDAEASGVAVIVVTSGIAEHTAISGAHHPRYTDAEAANAAANVLATGVMIAIVQESGVRLTVDATTTAVLPALSTLLTTSISLQNPSGCLRIAATAAANANGAVPLHFHVYIDGVFEAATTINVTGAIDNASIVIPRVAVTGVNPHTVDLRWAKFFLPGVTARCLPVSFPDFYHASLSVQEVV